MTDKVGVYHQTLLPVEAGGSAAGAKRQFSGHSAIAGFTKITRLNSSALCTSPLYVKIDGMMTPPINFLSADLSAAPRDSERQYLRPLIAREESANQMTKRRRK
jgi:hypothetical protein